MKLAGCLFRRKAADIAQDQNLAVVLRQIGDSSHQINSKILVRLSVTGQHRDLLLIPFNEKAMSLAGSAETFSANDLKQPGRECPNSTERDHSAIEKPERVLHSLLDIVRRTLPIGIASQLRPATTNQFQHRFFISSPCRANEIVHFHRHNLVSTSSFILVLVSNRARAKIRPIESFRINCSVK